MQEQLTAGATPSEMAAAANVSRSAACHYTKTGCRPSPQGRSLFFDVAEEKLQMQNIRTRALIGRGLTCDAFFGCCEDYMLVLPSARQDEARSNLSGETKLGKTSFHLHLLRWPNLTR